MYSQLDTARGLEPGVTYSDKFGFNPNVGTSYEDVWDAGGTYTGWLTAAQTIRVRSGGNAADTAAGAGARTVTIQGLDENWAEASETVTLAGASASAATTTTFIRVSRAFVATCGAYGGANTGNILIEETGASSLMAVIVAGNSQTQMFMLTVPAGQTGYLRSLHTYADSNKTMSIRLWKRENADTAAAPFTPARLVRTFAGVLGADDILGEGVPTFLEKTDIWVDAKASSSGGGISVIGTGWFVTG